MSLAFIIWGTAFIIYAIFWLWYVGFRKPLTKEEIDHYINKLQKFNNNSEAELISLRRFLESDAGKSFAKTLITYHKSFMKMMFKRGGIGIFQGRVAGNSVDVIGIENAEEWGISAINRFRSRRDFMELITHPSFHEKHAYKFAALKKSIASPIDPWFQLGGIPVVVGLVFSLVAAIIYIIIV